MSGNESGRSVSLKFPPLIECIGRSEFTRFAEYPADAVDSEWFEVSAPLSSRSIPLNNFIVLRMLSDVAQMPMSAHLGEESVSDVASYGASALSLCRVPQQRAPRRKSSSLRCRHSGRMTKGP
jgi:hypothetical protein